MNLLLNIFSIVWVVNHWKEVLIGLVVLIIIVRSIKRNKNKRIMAQEQQRREAAEAQRQREIAEAAEEQRKKELAESKAKEETKSSESTDSSPEIIIAKKIDGKHLAYHYDDVKIIPSNGAVLAKPSAKLNLVDQDGEIKVYQDNYLCLGSLPDNRLSEMVRDWQKRGDPIVAYNSLVGEGKVEIFLGFYTDVIARFLSKNPDAKEYRLTGKPDEFAYYTVGDQCQIEPDFDSDKFAVFCDGLQIGFLPKAAVTYAENNEIEPTDLEVLISNIEYDDEKDRDMIYVYITA